MVREVLNIKVSQAPDVDARCEPRINMFLMATLYSGASSAPVKVRDMSPGGALIESGAIPLPGQEVQLCRGSLQITGEVVWTSSGRAGLRFQSQINVTDWLPRGRATAPQTQIDEFVQQVKSSVATPRFREIANVSASNRLTALEVTQLRLALESLAEDLAADPDVVARHLMKLQTLDLTVQALTKIAAER